MEYLIGLYSDIVSPLVGFGGEEQLRVKVWITCESALGAKGDVLNEKRVFIRSEDEERWTTCWNVDEDQRGMEEEPERFGRIRETSAQIGDS